MYTIYTLYHEITGDDFLYIGCTRNLHRRLISHKSHTNRPVGRYTSLHGKKGLKLRILCYADTQYAANYLEESYVQKYKPILNRTPNGRSPSLTGDLNPMKRPENRAKFTGDRNPMKRPENKAKISGKNHPLYNKTHSAETRAKISASKKGTISPKRHPVWEQSDKVLEMFHNGFNKSQIAEHFGCTRTPIKNILKKHGL